MPLAFLSNLAYALTLLIAVSLAYSASRHEDMRRILIHAAGTFGWLAGGLGGLYLVLLWLAAPT